MVRLTKEQLIGKINSLNEKMNRLDARWEKKKIKLEKDGQKDLARCPYTEFCLTGNYTVTEEMQLEKNKRNFDFERELYEDSINKARKEISSLESKLETLITIENEKKNYKELRTPIPELIVSVRELIQEWIDEEKSMSEEDRYYSKMKEETLNEFVVMPIAQDITYRCHAIIGKIAWFTKPSVLYGKIEMFCFNAATEKCHLSATIVSGHMRTNFRGTTFFVKPHIRTITVPC